MSESDPVCFNCQRTEADIPIIAWRYRGRPRWVCSECMPLLIHKWAQIVVQLGQTEEPPG